MGPSDTTLLLTEIDRGNSRAVDTLLPQVYDRLRELADRLMRRERPGHTLQPTALVHEAYLELVDQSRVDWKGKTHFYCVAAMAMRRLLKEYARDQGRKKRGGEWRRVSLHEAAGLVAYQDVDFVELKDALEELEQLDPRSARVADMKLFFGLSHAEIAIALGVTAETVGRDWRFAKATLRKLLQGDSPSRNRDDRERGPE